MRKFNLLVIVSVLFSFIGYSQTVPKSSTQGNPVKVIKHKKLYVGLGGVYSSFQDVKYSNVRYGGIGACLDFGFEKSKNPLWGIGLNLIYSKEKAKTHATIGKAMVINAAISVKYLHPLIKNETQKLYLGGTWDILDLEYRIINGLGNNSAGIIFASNTKISSVYERKLSTDLKLQAGIDFQIFGFIQQTPSFGFSTTQNALETGSFSYQDEELGEPAFKYMNFEPFWNYFNIGTSLKLHYKNRWVLAYKWNMQRSNIVKNYPMTKGYNSISIIYNITNK